MKILRVLSLTMLVVLYGLPLPVLAQGTTEVFSLPDGIAGQSYRANIERVLFEKYRLKLEADGVGSVFRWSLSSGQLPQGLTLRPNGTIIGTPRGAGDTSYAFQVQVRKLGVADMAPLQINFDISIAAPRIRIVELKTPRLVSNREMTLTTSAESRDASDAQSASFQLNASPALNAVAFNNRAATGSEIGDDAARALHASFLRPAALNSVEPNNPAVTNQYAPVPVATPACNTALIPSGEGVYFLDARDGTLRDNANHTVSPRKRFGKKELVTIVVDNKNPYLYTYKYSSTLTPVVDAALNAFVPLITGNLSDLADSPVQDIAPNTTKAAAQAPAQAPAPAGAPQPPPKCQNAITMTHQLIADVQAQITNADNLKTALDFEKRKSHQLSSNYLAARIPIFSVNQPRNTLCSASIHLASVVNTGVDAGRGIDPATNHSPASGVDPLALDQIIDKADALTQEAEVINRRVSVIREAFPDCMNVETDRNKLLREHLREAAENADKLTANAKNYRDVVQQIRENLTAAIQGRNAALAVLNNQFAFYEVHSEGGYEETNAGPIQLEVTPRSGVVEAVAVVGSPFKLNFTFGKAPFFSISGGLLFSPLRKREFVRVQGFERDEQGNLVLTNGKPNLTTVVGLKEDSPTRITPAIFLNGRLSSPSRSKMIDGVYMSLGITAKNDNKGTDVEFLLGPSVSMFDRSMFFTVGGYAGKQQKLTGGLFEGFAVPADVDELPIQKNYRWHLGFAVSYRLPVNNK